MAYARGATDTEGIMGRDTRTRYQGVYARHAKGCPVEHGKACKCRPSYYGRVWNRRERKQEQTRRFTTAAAARSARNELIALLDRGESPIRSDVRTGALIDRYVQAIRSGVALNKKGRRYKKTAADDLEQTLRLHVEPHFARRRPNDLRRADVQALVDDLTAAGMSGSRVRSVVNAIRSLYRYAQQRELAAGDPAQLVLLPAMDATPRDRVVTPPEFRTLLDALPLADAIPYALAGYGSARRAEVLRLDWTEVDLAIPAMRLGADDDGAKTAAALRLMPLVDPLERLLRRHRLAQKAGATRLCEPRHRAKSGLMSPTGLALRAKGAWEDAGLEPIGLHECRHTFSTWLDHAGVSPKVASVLMGHSAPGQQTGAAAITLARYTHVLPGELDRARDLLGAFITDRESEAARSL